MARSTYFVVRCTTYTVRRTQMMCTLDEMVICLLNTRACLDVVLPWMHLCSLHIQGFGSVSLLRFSPGVCAACISPSSVDPICLLTATLWTPSCTTTADTSSSTVLECDPAVNVVAEQRNVQRDKFGDTTCSLTAQFQKQEMCRSQRPRRPCTTKNAWSFMHRSWRSKCVAGHLYETCVAHPAVRWRETNIFKWSFA